MASLQDLVKKYITEIAVNGIDKNQAAKNIAAKLRTIKYEGHTENVPTAHLIKDLRVIKGSANDSHIEVIEIVIGILEQGKES